MKFNERLKALRNENSLTQEELAKKIYVDRSLISKWESGDRFPNQDMLKRLAILFNLTENQLIGGDLEQKNYKRYAIISTVFSCSCIGISFFLVCIFIICLIEKASPTSPGDAWTAIGGLMISFFSLIPTVGLTVFEIVTLKKKNGRKSLELYSLLSLYLVWSLTFVLYLFIF